MVFNLLGNQKQNQLQALLGEYYDPRQARMQWIGGTLQGLGMGLATGRPGAWAEGAIAGGTEGAQNYRQQALAQYALKQRQDEDAYQREREQTQWDYRVGRDKVSDAQWAQEQELQKQRVAQAQSGGASTWGMNPIPLKNRKTGEFAIGQFNQGQGGVFLNGQPADPAVWAYDPGAVAQDRAFGSAVGGAQGEAVAGAPGDIAAADIALSKINDLRTDPNRAWGTGASAIFNNIPATPGYDYQNKVDEVTAGAFLTAIQQMRGLGQLSNVEGQTAKQAVTRMKTATSEQAFLDALNDYEEIVMAGKQRAQNRLSNSPAGSMPAPGGGPAPAAPSGRTSSGVPWSVE